MEYRIIITITKDIAHGEVFYRVEKDGEVIVPITMLRKSPAFAHQTDELDVVLIPARGGVGGGVSTSAPPEGRTLVRTTPAAPAAGDAREPWQRVAEDDMGLRVTR